MSKENTKTVAVRGEQINLTLTKIDAKAAGVTTNSLIYNKV